MSRNGPRLGQPLHGRTRRGKLCVGGDNNDFGTLRHKRRHASSFGLLTLMVMAVSAEYFGSSAEKELG